MKFTFYISIVFLLVSCVNPIEKSNEKVKSSIYKLGTEIKQNYSQYEKGIQSSGYLTLLSLDRLEKDKNQIESKNILRKAENIFKKFTEKNQSLVTELKSQLDSLQPTKSFNEKEIEEVKSIFKESIDVTKSNFKIDSTTISISKKIINLIDGDCNYVIQENQVRFYTEDCIRRYNFLNTQLESAIVFANFEISKRKLNKLNNN
ncbi:hypothetical protein [Hyunsoonleella rubra]|uniref:Lipoprotein n=1 Tax=Hyunsoonleella rubra TaxID=1737062 RepID=A0ABW5TAK0_9FLAO